MSQHLTPGRQTPAATIVLVQEYCCGLRQKCLQQAHVSKQLVPRWLHCLVQSGETFGTSDLVGKMCHWRLASEVIPSSSSCLLLCFLTIQDVRNSSHALPLPGSEISCQVGATPVFLPCHDRFSVPGNCEPGPNFPPPLSHFFQVRRHGDEKRNCLSSSGPVGGQTADPGSCSTGESTK